jgi:peptide/nickel transport system permease protein
MAVRVEAAPIAQPDEPVESGSRVLTRLRRNRVALTGGLVVGGFILMALVGPLLAPYDPLAVDLLQNLEGPSVAHPFGTDEVGRDILSRIVHGARTSLFIAVTGVAIALLAGVAIGQAAGYYGGLLDTLAMRLIDVMLAFPSILLAIVILSMLGPGLHSTIIAIGISSIPSFARLARASTLAEKQRDYVDAARALGATSQRILVAHILPNIAAAIIVQASLRMSTMILTAAGLSFIGLGVQPPTPEWGVMISQARAYLQESPHAILFPGLAVVAVVLGFNLFGDGLRDALDPRQLD